MVDLSTFFQSFIGTLKALIDYLIDNKIVFILFSLLLLFFAFFWLVRLLNNYFITRSAKVVLSDLSRGGVSLFYLLPITAVCLIARVFLIS